MLVEIHILQNHSPSNLNRDDTGSPKECMFGGVRRARISSQCLKRSIRQSDIFQKAMDGNLATRTRRLPELVRKNCLAAGLSEEMAEIAAKKASGFGTGEAKESDKPNGNGEYETRQTMFLSAHDVQAVTDVMIDAANKAGTPEKFAKVPAKDLQSSAELKDYRPISVDIALFGRMITSEAFRDSEACCQVAHAISTNKLDHEFDYFTAVDDLQGFSENDDAGADMIGDVEFNSSCYYKYFSIDVNGLLANLTGQNARRDTPVTEDDKKQAVQTASDAVEAMLKAATMTTPSGKQNTFAAHQLPAAILVEVRPYATPVSYANAFVEPARPNNSADLVRESLSKFARHIEAVTNGFNLESSHRLLLAPEHTEYKIDGVERVESLKDMSSKLKEVIANG